MLVMLKFKIIFIFLISFSVYLNPFRDPFSFQNNALDQLYTTSRDSYNTIKILAITESNKKNGAILQNNEEQEVVFVGDTIWGYKIKDIASDSVQLLKSDKKIVKLFFES